MADHMIKLGLRTSDHGSEIVFRGSVQELLKCSTSETARFLAEAAGASDKQP